MVFVVTPKIYKALKSFDTDTKSVLVPKQTVPCQQWQLLCLCLPVWPAKTAYERCHHWCCCQNLWWPSGIAFKSDGQIIVRSLSSNLDCNINFSAWPTSCMGFMLQNHKINFLRLDFLGLFKIPKFREALNDFWCSSQHCCTLLWLWMSPRGFLFDRLSVIFSQIMQFSLFGKNQVLWFWLWFIKKK